MRTAFVGRLPLLLFCLLASAATARAQVYRAAEMNTRQFEALDRARTAVLLPGGILEQHGPYLPSYSDGYLNEWLTERLAEAIVARPGWSAVIFPPIPLGTGGANEIGRRHVFPGTFAVRSSTLRAVFMDLATELGEQKFRWVFVVHGHGAPNHNRVLDQASDYFGETYGGRMVHLKGFVLPDGPEVMTEVERREDGFSVHAGLEETSELLFVRPDLVSPLYRQAPAEKGRTWRGQTWADLVGLARDPLWPGYFGAPHLATASRGAQFVVGSAKARIEYALKILDGYDERQQLKRRGDLAAASPANVAIDRDALAYEQEVERRQQAWLRKHNLR